MTLEWLFVAYWGIVIWSNYVIIAERTCTSESMNPRPCFKALQYRLCSLLSLVTLLFFIFSDYKNYYLLSILHLYHHLFAELVHLYNLPLYWVCWGLRESWIRGSPDSQIISFGGTVGLWRYKIEDFVPCSDGTLLGVERQARQYGYVDLLPCNRPCVTLAPSGLYINQRVLVCRTTYNHTIG